MFDIGSLIPSIIGMGAKIGSAIPGLKKPAKSQTAKAVAAAAPGVYGSAVGAAQAGHGASRGLALREGLRQATGGVSKLGAQIRQAAATDENINEQRKQARNQRIAQFGTDLAKGLGDMAAIGIKAKGEGTGIDDQPGERPEGEVTFGSGEVLPGEGVRDVPLPEDDSMGLDDLEQVGAQQQALEQEQLIADAEQKLGEFQEKREAAGIGDVEDPNEQYKLDPISQMFEQRDPSVMPEMELQLDRRFQAKELMLAEAERQGLSLESLLPRINRRLGLRPGQSRYNPTGMNLGDLYQDSPNYDRGDE